MHRTPIELRTAQRPDTFASWTQRFRCEHPGNDRGLGSTSLADVNREKRAGSLGDLRTSLLGRFKTCRGRELPVPSVPAAGFRLVKSRCFPGPTRFYLGSAVPDSCRPCIAQTISRTKKGNRVTVAELVVPKYFYGIVWPCTDSLHREDLRGWVSFLFLVIAEVRAFPANDGIESARRSQPPAEPLERGIAKGERSSPRPASWSRQVHVRRLASWTARQRLPEQ